ncbi:MAG: M48 family metallopeptidase [Polyangiaceae bacterium]|nr:M48 family metallopeptidase [Polyangiaceae bacterium]
MMSVLPPDGSSGRLVGVVRHPDHTREFWAKLGRVMPDYDERRQRLRAMGARLGW